MRHGDVARARRHGNFDNDAEVTTCGGMSRREFLRWSALVAATPLLPTPWEQRAYAQSAAAVALPINLELVTLTETSAIITWFTGDPTQPDPMGRLAPAPADTEVLLGTSPASLQVVHHDATPTPYHYVEISGLEPEQTYFYVARSNGMAAVAAVSGFGNPAGTSGIPPSPSGPFLFQTPAPPPGRFLFAVALSADMHLGEHTAGLATTQAGVGLPPGVQQVPGRPPYADIMAGALATEARARGAQLLVADGDISSDSAVDDLSRGKAYLDAFGALGRDYLVTRGNHDRTHEGKPDAFASEFFAGKPTWWAHEAFGLRILGLDTYDKLGDGSDNGVLSDHQWSFVRDTLAHDRDQPTLVLGHHPVTVEATLTTVPPVRFDMDVQQAAELEALYAATPGVFLHQSGHTHRNKRTLSSDAPGVVFQEVSAVKEYPGGFTLLRVFTGGYAMNFYKFKAPLAQEWSERSRPEYLGLAPYYEFGNALDRNSVVARDFSGLRATYDAAAAGGATVAPRPAPVLAVTGRDGSALKLGGALVAGGLAVAGGRRGMRQRGAGPERRREEEAQHQKDRRHDADDCAW
jgi:hypothetical protein